MKESSIAAKVAESFGLRPERIKTHGSAGGFSGSTIFRLFVNDESFCLKRWPNGYDPEKLTWVHRVLIFASANGCPEIVKPVESHSGETFVQFEHAIWELTPWADGAPFLPNEGSEEKLTAAIKFLARFHQATARFFFNFSQSQNVAITIERLGQFKEVISSIADKQTNDRLLSRQEIEQFMQRGGALASNLKQNLLQYKDIQLPVQPVIRDFRPEHLFFDSGSLTGVIDFGSMRVDTVSCDLARILSSCKDIES